MHEHRTGGNGLILILFIPYAVYAALVMKCLWFWFIVPIGLPPITVVHAIGLRVLFAALSSVEKTRGFTLQDALEQTAKWFVPQTCFLLVGKLLAMLLHKGF